MAEPRSSSEPPCPNGRWHYDDLSCCHAAVPYPDVEVIRTAIADARALLDEIERGRYVSAQRTSVLLADLEAAAGLLPDGTP